MNNSYFFFFVSLLDIAILFLFTFSLLALYNKNKLFFFLYVRSLYFFVLLFLYSLRNLLYLLVYYFSHDNRRKWNIQIQINTDDKPGEEYTWRRIDVLMTWSWFESKERYDSIIQRQKKKRWKFLLYGVPFSWDWRIAKLRFANRFLTSITADAVKHAEWKPMKNYNDGKKRGGGYLLSFFSDAGSKGCGKMMNTPMMIFFFSFDFLCS